MMTEAVDIWNECLQIIKEEIAPQSFDTWFKPIRPLKLEKKVLTVEVPSQFFYEWLEDHYLQLLKKAIHYVLGAEGRLEYSIIISTSNVKTIVNTNVSIEIDTIRNEIGNANTESALNLLKELIENSLESNPKKKKFRNQLTSLKARFNLIQNDSFKGASNQEIRSEITSIHDMALSLLNKLEDEIPQKNSFIPKRNSFKNGANSSTYVNRSLPNPFETPRIQNFKIDSNLDANSTFESFLEGDCNRLARAAGFAVANKPGVTAYNPLFLYSGVGLGKTHLLQAIGNKVKELYPQKNLLYVSSERFTNQFVEAVRKNTVNDFMNFYQMIDVLLVDDIQFFSGKEKTQDNFFHIFNHLRQSGKQIALASDRAPHQMEGMEERLLSRFKWGLSAELKVPDYATRKLILKSKMYQNGIELAEDVVDFIAHNVNSNIRELEGALISLLAQSSLNRQDVDISLARDMLKNFIETVSREVTIDSIQQIVAEYFAIEVDQLKAKTRKRDIVQARQIAMYFSKEMTRHSLKTIGNYFGGRSHSVVIHALQTVNDLIATDKYFKQSVVEIRKRISLEMG